MAALLLLVEEGVAMAVIAPSLAAVEVATAVVVAGAAMVVAVAMGVHPVATGPLVAMARLVAHLVVAGADMLLVAEGEAASTRAHQ